MPYGQPMPMQAPPRRHDGSYAPMPPQMRHPGYQPYYPQQHMGPMMPQYPQQYAPNWYPYQQQPMHPMHHQRHHYYPQQQMPPSQYHQMPMASQPMQPQPSPRPMQNQAQVSHMPPPSSASTASTAPVQTPPSPPLSTSTSISTRKELPSQPASPAPQRVQSPSNEPIPESERFFPPVSCITHAQCIAADLLRLHGCHLKAKPFLPELLGSGEGYLVQNSQASRSSTHYPRLLPRSLRRSNPSSTQRRRRTRVIESLKSRSRKFNLDQAHLRHWLLTYLLKRFRLSPQRLLPQLRRLHRQSRNRPLLKPEASP